LLTQRETEMDTTISTRELENLRLLRGESSNDLQWVLQHGSTVVLPRGTVLLSPENDNRALYLILEGRMQVHLCPDRAEAVTLIDAGDCVGEMSIIDGRPPSATVVADTDCRLLVLTAEAVWALIDRSPVVARNLLHILSSRVRSDNVVIMQSLRQQRRFEHSSRTDPLTGLYNRRWLDEALENLWQRTSQNGEPFSLLMLDVDHFKRYNDTYGHSAGDRVLHTVATTIRAQLRTTDSAVRYGGEEFVVLMPHQGADSAQAIAERLCEAVRNQPLTHLDGTPLPGITVSVGWATKGSEQGPAQLLANADAALYAAKRAGRNRVSNDAGIERSLTRSKPRPRP
jgi:diguanylate cyclase (GGDEF)-like protein